MPPREKERSSKQGVRRAADVDGYIRQFPPKTRTALKRLRTAIRTAAPMSEEVISYGIPTYKHFGMLVHFMAKNDRCSFITTSYRIVEVMRGKLKRFSISGTTIHFTPDAPIAPSLVAEIVRKRVKENEAHRTRR